MSLTDFLLARIAEDEDWITRGEVRASDMRPNDTRRMLAECEAKRRLVQIHGNDRQECMLNNEPEPCKTIRAVAAVYADHPDYRDDWKP